MLRPVNRAVRMHSHGRPSALLIIKGRAIVFAQLAGTRGVAISGQMDVEHGVAAQSYHRFGQRQQRVVVDKDQRTFWRGRHRQSLSARHRLTGPEIAPVAGGQVHHALPRLPRVAGPLLEGHSTQFEAFGFQ